MRLTILLCIITLSLGGCGVFETFKIEPAESEVGKEDTVEKGGSENKSYFKLNYYPRDMYQHKNKTNKDIRDKED